MIPLVDGAPSGLTSSSWGRRSSRRRSLGTWGEQAARYAGRHCVEVYVVKNDKVIASEHHDVTIG